MTYQSTAGQGELPSDLEEFSLVGPLLEDKRGKLLLLLLGDVGRGEVVGVDHFRQPVSQVVKILLVQCE